MRRRSRLLLALCAAAALAMLAASQARAAAEADVMRTTTPVTWLVFLPCPTRETGELIQLSGQLQTVTTFVRDANGATHGSSHSTFQNVTGVGLTSGARYRVIQSISFVANTNAAGPPPWAISNVANWRIIGEGGALDWSFWARLHITVTPDWEATAFFDTSSSTCK